MEFTKGLTDLHNLCDIEGYKVKSKTIKDTGNTAFKT